MQIPDDAAVREATCGESHTVIAMVGGVVRTCGDAESGSLGYDTITGMAIQMWWWFQAVAGLRV